MGLGIGWTVPMLRTALRLQMGEVVFISTSKTQMNALLWTDPETKITFRLLASLGKDVMNRMAESISPK